MCLKEGDVIALAAPNSPDTVLGFLGSMSGGFVITPMNPYYTVGKLLYDITLDILIQSPYMCAQYLA